MTEKKALILTHPFGRFADVSRITDYLEKQEKYSEVFYVGQSEGRIPVDWKTVDQDMNRECGLPEGFESGYYECGLEDDGHGRIKDNKLEEIISDYQEIGVGGSEHACSGNSLDSIVEEIEDSDYICDTYMEEELI